jgi:hypothetical protein
MLINFSEVPDAFVFTETKPNGLSLQLYLLVCSENLSGPKRDEVTAEWRKLHNEALNDLYSLPNIVRVVKSRRMRWAGHVARMGG